MTHTRKLGILGGGQLAQMLALAAVPLGVRCHIYDPSPDAPAQLVATHSVAEYTNALTLAQFAGNVDAITYEFENVPASTATTLAQHKPLYPPARALAIAQDRLSEKQFFQRPSSRQDCLPSPKPAATATTAKGNNASRV